MNPRTMALAYRIWGDCKLHGWDRSVAEIAESLGETEARIRRVAQIKDWLRHFRATADGHRSTPLVSAHFDDELEAVPGRWPQPMRIGAE